MSILQAFILAFMHGRRDVTGYDITKGCFGCWSHQQVYRDLKKLKDSNLIRNQTIPQDGKPDREACTPNAGAKTTLVNLVEEFLRDLNLGSQPRPHTLMTVAFMYDRSVIDSELYTRFLDAYHWYHNEIVEKTKDAKDVSGLHANRLALAECSLAEEIKQTLV